ncbi:MAG: sugar ABC transporter ATP-binding protein [Bacteroidota bacterium]
MKSLAFRATSVSMNFGNICALDNVSFELEKGEVHCLAGENGSGKSTLIKVINGVYVPEPGALFQFGDKAPVSRISPADSKSRGIHVIWQDLSLFPDLSVGENIIFDEFIANPLSLTRSDSALKRARCTLDELGIDVDLDIPLGSLSIAQRQLVAISRVLQTDAGIIFMDEPTASLTRTETQNLFKIVHKLSDKGISIVFVSHRLAEALEVSSRVTVLRDGKFVGTFPTEGMTQKRLTMLMTGQVINEKKRSQTTFGDTVLEVDKLTVQDQFEDISFSLRSGEILGLTGLLGSGRSEISHAIFGMTKPENGRILIDGNDVSLKSNRDAIKHGVAYVSEDRLNIGLHQTQSIIKNTGVTTLKALSKPSYFLDPERIRKLCRYWIDRLKVKVNTPDLAVNSLSGGNQQRIVLAKWLATNPKILILDSPTVGVDVRAKAGIFQIIRDLASKGMAIMLISDEAGEIHTHSDSIIVLREGRISHRLSPEKISEKELEIVIND